MLPVRLVVDTNIVVSAALKPESLPRTALLIALVRPARLYASPAVLAEYKEVLARPELRIRKGLRLRLLQLIRNSSRNVEPRRRLDVTADPRDNIFLECADAGGADYLITGNLRHFPRYWKKTKVVSVREFLSIAAPHLIR